jgi:hypothetical protein
MKSTKFNWPIWTGFLISVIGFISYFQFFVNYPITRDLPWANLLLFAVAIVLAVFGLRRGFGSDRKHRRLSKIVSSVAATLTIVIAGLFVFTIFVAGRWLPPAKGAPNVGQRAPDFTLSDSNGKSVSLSELLTAPVNGSTPKAVLLVFYRGYW